MHAINDTRVVQFAKQHGLPVITWRLPLQAKFAARLSGAEEDKLYETVRDLNAYFVVGCPITITANLRPERGLSNGTEGKLHSIVLSMEEPPLTRDAFMHARPGEIVRLQFPPYAVLVSIASGDVDMPGLAKTPAGETIIPLLPTSRNVTISRYLKMPQKTKKETVLVTAHPYHLLFATTYHGVQCRTLPKIVLCVSWPSQPALTYNAFYVGISRVRTGEDVRLLQLPNSVPRNEMVARLRSMVPKATLVQYMLGHRSTKETWEYLTTMYKKVGIAYGKHTSDKTCISSAAAVKTYTCRRLGCQELFTSDVARARHEKVCTHQGVQEGTYACKYQCGLSWPKESHCKKHEKHCKKRPHEQEAVVDSVAPTGDSAMTPVVPPPPAVVMEQPTVVPAPMHPHRPARRPRTAEDEEDNVNENLNAFRQVLQPKEVERYGKRRKC